MGFRAELKRLRESVSMSANALDRRLGRTNYVNRLEDESGTLPIPAYSTVIAIGDALRELGADTSGERLWHVAEDDPDLAPSARELVEHYRRQVEDAHGFELTAAEQRLVHAIRTLGADGEDVSIVASELEVEGQRGRQFTWRGDTYTRHPPPAERLALALAEASVRLHRRADGQPHPPPTPVSAEPPPKRSRR